MKIPVIIITVSLLAILFFVQYHNQNIKKEVKLELNQKIRYPYIATETRIKRIKSEYLKIKKGMSAQKVIEIMGKPDETQPLFTPQKKRGKQIGFTCWYLIQRLKKNGSANERAEILVRVSYNKTWIVTAVDHWGF